jgi:hypothetical protein
MPDEIDIKDEITNRIIEEIVCFHLDIEPTKEQKAMMQRDIRTLLEDIE